MSESKSKSNSWFSTFSDWELLFDRCLKIGEAAIVLTIATALVLFVVREVLWVWYACTPTIRQKRIETALKMLNDNWKVGLLILVPLFYRTIRMFLERVRKVLGMEAREPEKVEEKLNPPDDAAPQAQEQGEEA